MTQLQNTEGRIQSMYDHEKLQIWRRANALAANIHGAVNLRRRGCTATSALKSQLLRACLSIGANIAEAAGQETAAQSARFLDVSIGSLSETQSHLAAASATQLIAPAKGEELIQECREIRAMCVAFKRWVLTRSGR